MTTLEQKCDDYIKKVYPSDISAGQAKDLKQTFFAGAKTVFMHMLTSIDEGTDEECEDKIALINYEIDAVLQKLLKINKKPKH